MPERRLRALTWRGILFLLIAAAAGAALMPSGVPGGDSAPVTGGTVRARRGTMIATVIGPGRVRSREAVDIRVPTGFGGERQLLYLIPEGTEVVRNQILAKLDTVATAAELESDLDEYRELLDVFDQLVQDQENLIQNQENQIRSAEIALEQAELRLKNLDYAAEIEREQARLDVEKARISRDEAHRKLEAQKTINEAGRRQEEIRLEGVAADVEEMRQELRSLIIRAPIDGLVIHADTGRGLDRRKILEGDMLRGRQLLLRLPNLSVLEAEVRLNELDAALVETGMTTTITLDALPGRSFRGRIVDRTLIVVEQSSNSNVRVAPVIVEILDPGPQVRPGMTARADVEVAHLEDAILVPSEAVQLVDGIPCVLPVGESDPVPVRVGFRNLNTVQITRGVAPGAVLQTHWQTDSEEIMAWLAGRVRLENVPSIAGAESSALVPPTDH